MEKAKRSISYDPLWKRLVDVKWKKSEMAEKAGIGRGTITRMGKNEPVGLDVILKICQALDCDVSDVVSILPDGACTRPWKRPRGGS